MNVAVKQVVIVRCQALFEKLPGWVEQLGAAL